MEQLTSSRAARVGMDAALLGVLPDTAGGARRMTHWNGVRRISRRPWHVLSSSRPLYWPRLGVGCHPEIPPIPPESRPALSLASADRSYLPKYGLSMQNT